LLLLSGDYIKSSKLFNYLISTSSNKENKIIFLQRLVFCQERLDDYKGLIKSLTVLIEFDSDTLICYQKLGRAYYGTGDFKRAMVCWRKLVEPDPSDVDSWLSFASILGDFNLVTEQLKILREGKAVTSSDKVFAVEIFPLLVVLERYDDAIDEIGSMIISQMTQAEELVAGPAVNNNDFQIHSLKKIESLIHRYPSIAEYYLFYDFLDVKKTGSSVLKKLLLNIFSKNDVVYFAVLDELVNRKKYDVVLPLLIHSVKHLKGDRLHQILIELVKVRMALGHYNQALETTDVLFQEKHLSSLSLRIVIMLKGRLLFDHLHKISEARTFWESTIKTTATGSFKDLYSLQLARVAIADLDLNYAFKVLSSVVSSASSGLKADLFYEEGRFHLLKGDFEKGTFLLSESIVSGKSTSSSSAALELMLFVVAHKVPDKATMVSVKDYMVLYLKLKTLLDAHNMVHYDKLAKRIVPEEIPEGLYDEFLLLQADRCSLKDDSRQELAALEQICHTIHDSPYIDRVLFRIASIYLDRLNEPELARPVLERHLLEYPHSIKVEAVRRMLLQCERKKSVEGDM